MINLFILCYFKLIITHLTKIGFHDSRPCFENEILANNECSCEFGFPSGHSSESFVMYFWIFYEFLFKNKSTNVKLTSISLFISLTFLTGLGRLYYGVHFID